MERIGETIISLLVFILSLIMSSFVLMKTWGWFITPVFNVNTLVYAQCIGLSFFIGVIKKRYRRQDFSDDRRFADKIAEQIAFTVVVWPISLLLGWIIHLIIG